jgi:hypothetical protein
MAGYGFLSLRRGKENVIYGCRGRMSWMDAMTNESDTENTTSFLAWEASDDCPLPRSGQAPERSQRKI